jgi:hypothetical protein
LFEQIHTTLLLDIIAHDRLGGAHQKVPLKMVFFDLNMYVTFDCAGIAAF